LQPRISGLSRRGFNVWRSRVAPSCSQHLHLSWERSEKFSCIQPRHAALIGCISLAGAQARPEQQDRSGVLGRWGAFPPPSLALRAVALPMMLKRVDHHCPARDSLWRLLAPLLHSKRLSSSRYLSHGSHYGHYDDNCASGSQLAQVHVWVSKALSS
jgi:hypothetical protein